MSGSKQLLTDNNYQSAQSFPINLHFYWLKIGNYCQFKHQRCEFVEICRRPTDRREVTHVNYELLSKQFKITSIIIEKAAQGQSLSGFYYCVPEWSIINKKKLNFALEKKNFHTTLQLVTRSTASYCGSYHYSGDSFQSTRHPLFTLTWYIVLIQNDLQS